VFANFVSRNGWFFVALGWGMLGIVVNNWMRLGTHGLAIAAAIFGAYILLRRIRFGARGSYPAKP
jgi:vacuolar-type H+-ATPase subunit I/STV1